VFCPNCGTQNDDNGVKCQKCGFNLKGATAPKFKGTMLMMNSPLASARRSNPAPGGSAPAPAPWPKSMAKATMIGVAPPSPGGVAPPGRVGPPPAALPISHGPPMPTPSVPAVGGTATPAGGAAPATAGVPPGPAIPVNPFGGTLVMGSNLAGNVAGVSHAPNPGSANFPGTVGTAPADRTVASEGAPAAKDTPAPSLDSTTPSVSPPPKGLVSPATKDDLPAFPSVEDAAGPAAISTDASPPAAARADWGLQASGGANSGRSPTGPGGGMAAAIGRAPIGKVRPIGLVVALGFVTFGIYWLIALWGALNDFKEYRQSNDITPILFFVPILGLLEIIKLPPKIEEARGAVGVVNPVPPNVVLYVLFPQIFFIADLNEIFETIANRGITPRIAS